MTKLIDRQQVTVLAEQGNPQAIATFMNASLQAVGITAKAALENGYLKIKLEADKPLNQQRSVAYICKVITRLKLESQKSVQALAVYAKKRGEKQLLWCQKLELLTERASTVPPEMFSELKPSVIDSLSAYYAQKDADEKPCISSQQVEPAQENTIDALFAYF